MNADAAAFVRDQLGHQPKDLAAFERALTHSSLGKDSYERLEFLGDRVLGQVMARTLYDRHPSEPEGFLSRRYNVLVARETCAEIGRELGIPEIVRLGKQARDDGAHESDNVLGDVMEALLGANFLESSFSATREIVHDLWEDAVSGHAGRSKHPKSALQEWAAGNRRKPPEYEVSGRSGPDHAAKFTVRVSVHNVGEVEATGSSKQDAETEAARLFMERFG